MVDNTDKKPVSHHESIGLAVLFGAMYFVQGIAEPTEGLIAQPVRSLLKSWNYSATAIAGFGALLAVPWMIKPLYGLLTDFVPLAGTRRRSYLLVTSGAATAGLFALYLSDLPTGAYSLLLVLLLVPTIGVAFSDVVVDALMIEKGQPRGLTGQLQSIQWGAMYGGGMIAALVGGWLSHHELQREGFLDLRPGKFRNVRADAVVCPRKGTGYFTWRRVSHCGSRIDCSDANPNGRHGRRVSWSSGVSIPSV